MSSDKIREEAKSLNIMNFKLSSGEEIIGYIHRNVPSESVILVEDPLLVVTVPSRDGTSYTINLQEWNPLAEESITAILRMNIVAYSKANINTRERYLSTIVHMHIQDDIEDNTSATVH